MKTLILVLLILTISCNSKLERFGYVIPIDQTRFEMIASNESKNFYLKIFNNPYQIAEDYILVIKFDSVVVFKEKYEQQKLTKLTIPNNFLDQTIKPSAIIYKPGEANGFYFEGKTLFYLHEKDNFLSVIFSESSEYSERFFIASQEIIGL
jgi:DUF1365 family protein